MSKADDEKKTERILVTYEHTKSPSKHSGQPTKVDVIEVPSTEVNETIDRLESNKEVKHVEKDQPIYLLDDQLPNDSLFSYQKSWVDQIHLGNAWKAVPNTDSSLKVAVIDSGVDLTHPDLKMNLLDGVNLIDREKSVQDLDGHGTKVAGLIGAETNNRLGVISPSRGVSIMPIKVTENGTGNLSTVVQGIRYAIDHDADMINLSLGNYNNSFALRTVIEEAISKNIFIVGAAGNDNDSAVVFPAAYPGVLAVAAIKTSTEEKASFSNYGSLVDIAAPGTDIYSTSLNKGYSFDEGTSMSAPIVTSSAVLLKEYAPYLTNKQLFKLVKETASPLNNSLGNGLLNVEAAVNGVTKYHRIYGDTAIDTAVEISKNNWNTLEEQTLSLAGENKKGRFVVLARSDEFPDSLAASPLASMLESPILLTKQNGLSEKVLSELSRLNANHVLIIGGMNAIPESISNRLKAANIKSTRIAGENRYETATEIARIMDNENTNQGFIVSGEKFPDALSISSYASRLEAPVLFTKENALPNETEDYLKSRELDHAYVIGGKEVIANQVLTDIQAKDTERIGGEDRFDTNFKVLLRFGIADSSQLAYFATGLKFPDALTGGAAAARSGDTIILIHPSRENEALVKSNYYLNNQGINNYRILGGPEAISQEKAWKIDQLLVQ